MNSNVKTIMNDLLKMGRADISDLMGELDMAYRTAQALYMSIVDRQKLAEPVEAPVIRQKNKVKIPITAAAVKKMVLDRWFVLPEVFTIKKLRDVLVAHGHDLPTNISRAANCALLQLEAEGRVKRGTTKVSYKPGKVTLWTRLPTEPRRQDPASGVILAGDENPGPVAA